MKINNAALTNCGVVQDGHAVRLDLVDDKGTEVSLELSLEWAQTIAKTLPSLLTRALQTATGNASSRFVLTLDRWAVEQSNDGTTLLLVLAAGDGYEVCIEIPREACEGLGLIFRSYKVAVTAKPEGSNRNSVLEGTQLSENGRRRALEDVAALRLLKRRITTH